jgi:hypothetical protein
MPRRLPCQPDTAPPLGAPSGAPLRDAAGSPAKKTRIAHVEQEEEVEVLEDEVKVVEEVEVDKHGNKCKVCSAAAGSLHHARARLHAPGPGPPGPPSRGAG